MATQGRDEEAREDPRLSAMIPVRVQIAQAWEGTTGAALAGAILNVSRGGAQVHLLCVIAPRTRLAISVPTGTENRSLLSEVVWTSLAPGRGFDPGLYGVRWMEKLAPKFLESLLPRIDRTPPVEREDATGT